MTIEKEKELELEEKKAFKILLDAKENWINARVKLLGYQLGKDLCKKLSLK
jgi:hypothetical protein